MPEQEGHMTADQFLNHVDDVQTQMRAAGMVTVYFQHDTMTPGNIRARWDDTPLNKVPGKDEVVDLPHAGYMGIPARWQVVRVETLASGTGVIVHCQDAPDAFSTGKSGGSGGSGQAQAGSDTGPANRPQPPATPIHDRLAPMREQLDTVNEFLEWLMSRYGICVAHDTAGYVWCGKRQEKLVAEWLEINLEEFEKEKRALLDFQRKLNKQQSGL